MRGPTATPGAHVGYRDVDREAFHAALRRNGPRAYDEFVRAEEFRADQG